MATTGERRLADLMGRDLAGLVLLEGWWLEVDHGLMTTRPALVVSKTGGKADVVCAADPEVAEDILRRLPECRHKKHEIMLLVNADAGWAYNVQNERRGETRPMRFLDRAGLDRLLAENPEPFQWG